MRVTTSCQAKCEFCNATGMLHDLVTDLPSVRARAAQAARMGCRTVSFTGGEPTLRRDLPLLIATARDEGIGGVELQTNGILLARKALVARLAKAGLSSIFLSLHSKDAALHDALLQVPGAHAKALLGACHVADRGVRVAVNHVITTHNMADLPSFMTQLAARLGPMRVTLSYMAPQGEGAKRLLWMPRLGEAAAMMARAIDRGKALGIEVRIPGLCGIPACLLPGYENHLEELHDSVPPPRLVSRRQVPACQDCPHRERCSGFWNAYLDRFGEQELRPRLVPP